MKKAASLLIVLLLLICSSCGTTPAPNIPINDTTPSTNIDTTTIADIGYSLEEARIYADSSIFPVFIKRNDLFYPVDNYRLEGISAYPDPISYGIIREKSGNISTLNLSSDEILVTFDAEEESYTFCLIEDMHYCIPALVFDRTEWIYGLELSYLLKNDAINISEVEGLQIKGKQDLISALESQNAYLINPAPHPSKSSFLICSGQKSFLSGGYYENTTWHECTLNIDSTLYHFPQEFSLPVITTKDGYFVIDTSSLSSGQYAIGRPSAFFAEPRFFVIEVS